jgi:hypothetical protein
VRLLPLAVIPVLVLSLSGCTNTAGPLVTATNTVTWCADSGSDSDMVFGIYIKDAGPHPITITSLSFGTVSHVSVKGAWVVPNYQDGATTESVGAEPYPLTSAAWKKRQDVVGASVPGNTESNIAVRLTLKQGATSGFAKGATVKYTDADHQDYVVTDTTVIGFDANGHCG